jgi:gamma-glutamylaminecyclotransferase
MTANQTKRVFICGCALRGQPDHQNLQTAQFIGVANTKPNYRLHSVADGLHPGIYEVKEDGIAIPGEVYEMSLEEFENLAATEPPNMYPQDVVLEDGEILTAFLYPEELVKKYNWPDISHYGGWAYYKKAISLNK